MAWRKSRELIVDIYKISLNFKDYSFKDQIQRSAMSIANNIAEGFERNTNKELVYFLYVAKGSCGETRSMIQIAGDLNYINNKDVEKLKDKCEEISKILSGFIKKI